MKVTALIPAHNEADSIAATVRAALSVEGIDHVVVIDDCSSDGTAEIATGAGAQTLRLKRNVGKGAALDRGLAEIGSPDAIVLLDGDLGDTAAQADRLLSPIESGEADMTIATFPPPSGPAGFGLVKRLARRGIATLGGEFEATAPLSGQRAIRASRVGELTPFAFGYGVEVGLTVRALRAGLRVLEVPTTMAHAATGRDIAGFAHRGRQFVHVLRALWLLRKEG